MPKAMKQTRNANALYAANRAKKPKYSAACQRVLDVTPEQFAEWVNSGVWPDWLFGNDDKPLSLIESCTVKAHCCRLMADYLLTSYNTEATDEPENDN